MGLVIGFICFGLFTGLVGFVWGYCKASNEQVAIRTTEFLNKD